MDPQQPKPRPESSEPPPTAGEFYGTQAPAEIDDGACEPEPALQRLGPSPFPRGFPVLGLLATMYEHVAAHARRRVRGGADQER